MYAWQQIDISDPHTPYLPPLGYGFVAFPSPCLLILLTSSLEARFGCLRKWFQRDLPKCSPNLPNRQPTRHQKGSPRTSLKLSQADLQADSQNVAFVFKSIGFLCICVIWYAWQQIQTLGPGTRGKKLGSHSRPTPIIPHPPPARLARLGLTRLSSARLGSARLGSAQLGPARLSLARLSPAWPGPARLPHFFAPSTRQQH